MMILAFVVVAGVMGFYALTQSRAPTGTRKPGPRDPLKDARDRLRRQIELMEGRQRNWRENVRNGWSEGTLEQLRAELQEVERQLDEKAASR